MSGVFSITRRSAWSGGSTVSYDGFRKRPDRLLWTDVMEKRLETNEAKKTDEVLSINPLNALGCQMSKAVSEHSAPARLV